MLKIKNDYFTLSVDLSSGRLTRKEKEIIRLLLAGYDAMTVSILTERSVKTVSTQKLSAYKKLGVKSDLTLFPVLIKRWGMQVSCHTQPLISGRPADAGSDLTHESGQ
ncbi:helix-turn-helix domain-containing protein [Escherichia coli]|uniref:Bacterial regulatory protein, LuxR family n=1 Tax=Escherichia coli TA447 TaxID=656447 RepID=A0A1X3ITP8_ECOLX|nr:helix-turn-helix domain-containing protein [Escherichia coli]OSK88086.1 bacterial regulatory protein, LuxR family [Escherichia coli TA447]